PDAVPPESMADWRPWMIIQRYDSIELDMVPKRTRSMGVNGTSRNLRMVNELPNVETSLAKVACRRLPSRIVASRMGSAMETCLPARWARRMTNESRWLWSRKRTVVVNDSYFRW